MIENYNMNKDAFDFIYNAEADCYDLVVDKKIQKVVEELKALPHDWRKRSIPTHSGWLYSTHFRCGKGVKRGLKNGALPFNID